MAIVHSAFRKFCLIGLEPFQEAEVARRVILANAFAWIACFLTLPTFVFHLYLGARPLLFLGLMSVAGLLSVPLLNWLHLHLISRITLFLFALSALAAYSRFGVADIGISLFYLPLSALPFYLFTPRERLALPMAVLPVVLFFVIKHFEPAWSASSVVFSESAKFWIRYSVWFECFLGLLAPAFIQYQMSLRSSVSLEKVQLERIQSSRVLALVEMSGGLAHEINNPLAIISGNADLIRKAASKEIPDRAKIEHSIDSIQENIARISRTMKALKLIAREGDAQKIERVSASSLIRGVLGICEKRVEDLKIDLTVDCAPDLELEVSSSQLTHVLFNLIVNSVHAVMDLPERWIRISSIEKGDSIEISVTDSGLGVPRAIQDRIMEPFFTTKEVGEGMGVGLSISRSFVEAHGGRLIYDTGSTNTRFIVRLPRRHIPQLRAA